MAKVESYNFPLKEVLELMIKDAGVHEGRWQLQVNFSFTAANMGPDSESQRPAAISIINHLILAIAKEDSPSSLTLDAAEVNPKPTS